MAARNGASSRRWSMLLDRKEIVVAVRMKTRAILQRRRWDRRRRRRRRRREEQKRERAWGEMKAKKKLRHRHHVRHHSRRPSLPPSLPPSLCHRSRSQKKSLLSLYGFWGLHLSSTYFGTWIHGAGSEDKSKSQNKSLLSLYIIWDLNVFVQLFWDLDLWCRKWGKNPGLKRSPFFLCMDFETWIRPALILGPGSVVQEVRTNPSPKSSNEGTSIETCICSGRREGPYAQIEVTKSEKGTSFETWICDGGREAQERRKWWCWILGWVFGYGLYNRWEGILRTFGNEDWDDYFHPWREPQNKRSMR